MPKSRTKTHYMTPAQASQLFNPTPHRTTVWRWMTYGTRRDGYGVRLRYRLIGRMRYTTAGWVEQFKRESQYVDGAIAADRR